MPITHFTFQHLLDFRTHIGQSSNFTTHPLEFCVFWVSLLNSCSGYLEHALSLIFHTPPPLFHVPIHSTCSYPRSCATKGTHCKDWQLNYLGVPLLELFCSEILICSLQRGNDREKRNSFSLSTLSEESVVLSTGLSPLVCVNSV